MGTEAGAAKRLPMERNLRDPVFGNYLWDVREDVEYSIDYLKGKSERYRLKVFDFPSLVRSDAIIEPPSYAKTETKTVEDTRRVTVAEGSAVTWRCTFNKPLQVSELINEQGEATAMIADPKDPLTYSVRFTLTESKRWKLSFRDTENRKPKFDESLSVKVLPNNPPEVKLAKATDVRVSPIEELVLKATAKDDYGLVRAGLSYSLGAKNQRM